MSNVTQFLREALADADRAIGFLVDDLDDALNVLSIAGVTPGNVNENDRERYVHFRAPDHQLYELIERKIHPIGDAIA